MLVIYLSDTLSNVLFHQNNMNRNVSWLNYFYAIVLQDVRKCLEIHMAFVADPVPYEVKGYKLNFTFLLAIV